MTDWYGAWKKQKDQVITPENYASKEEFDAVLDSFEDFEADTRNSFEMEEVDSLIPMAHGEKEGFFYGRAANPATKELERRVVLLEGGHIPLVHEVLDAVALPAGMAAISTTVEALYWLSKDERTEGKRNRFLLVEPAYTQTKTVLKELLPVDLKETVVIDSRKGKTSDITEKIEELGDKIIAVIFEPVKNPSLEYTDTREVAKAARKHGVPVVVDNTFLTPYLQQSFRMGADIVMHSGTKYMGPPNEEKPSDLFSGVVTGPKGFINAETYGVRALRSARGFVPSVRDLNLIINRLPSLDDKVEAHCRNARELSEFLKNHQHVESVLYPDLGEETRDGKAGGVVTYILKGKNDREKADRSKRLTNYLIKNKGQVSYETSLGDHRTLILPFDTLGYNIDELKGAGYQIGIVRVAVGREEDFRPTIEHLNKGMNYACSK